jgi:hypothetical protein
MRHIPIFTFINKLDREARDPFDLLDELEHEFNIGTYPMNWPIGCGQDFRGVYDREKREVLAFDQFHQGRNRISGIQCDISDTEKLDELIGERCRRELVEQVELTLITATGKEITEKGRIAFCDNEIQPGTGTQNIWAVFENADRSLAPGGVVTVRVHRKADFPVLGVPAEAILTDTRGKYVYIIKHNRAVVRRILCGSAAEDGRVAVFSGLQPGDQVITTNLADMEEDIPVQAK